MVVIRFSSRSSAASTDAGREQRRAAVEHLLRGHRGLVNGLAVLVRARFLLQPRHRLLQRLQIGQDQLGLDDLDVGPGVDLAVDVHDVVVGEDPHHLTDRVALADVGQELVAKPGALRRALDDAGDVDERHRRRHDLLRREHLRELVEPRIRQRTTPSFGSIVANG